MGCRNALLVRYKVFIDEETGPASTVPLDDITMAGGLSLGEEGTVTIPEWDRDIDISNGKRKIPAVTLKYKLKGETLPTFKYFADWWNKRNSVCRNVRIEILDRAWQLLYTFVYTGVEMGGHKMEDQDLGTPKLGIWEVTLRPYDVYMTDENGNIIISPGGVG
jgi:hypothetical protein